MKINSLNEWDQLRLLVLGTVENYSPLLEFPAKMSLDERLSAQAIAKEAFPSWYLDEVAEDLADFSALAASCGVHVLRPRWVESGDMFSTPNWDAAGYDIFNVRDLHLVVGSTLVSAPSASRARLFEHYAMQELLYKNFDVADLRWIYAPTPRLRGVYLHDVNRPMTELEQEENRRHLALGSGRVGRFRLLDEREIRFDAANVIRLGSDLLYLVSNSGNYLGGRWLQAILGPEFKVHFTETYRSSHLDSTILPLRDGLVLLNAARVNHATCPAIFENWDKIYFDDCAPVPEEEIDFHRNIRLPIYHKLRERGIVSSLDHITSPWIGLNLLMLKPGVAFVHDRQVALIRALEEWGCEVIPVRLRHPYTMHGGLHCMTLDLYRES